jgi:hypothetical protein
MNEKDLEEFVRLETAVWQALVDGDAEMDAALLTDDFLGVYPSGFAGRDDHVRQLADGPTVASFELSEARLLVISDDAMMLSYRADSHPVAGTAHPEPAAMYISSLWCRRDGRWLNLFSQDTPAQVTPCTTERTG